jgi:hypothetical protein
VISIGRCSSEEDEKHETGAKVIPVVPYLIQNVTDELLNGPRRDVIKGRNVMRPKARGRQNATRECHADIDKERGVL